MEIKASIFSVGLELRTTLLVTKAIRDYDYVLATGALLRSAPSKSIVTSSSSVFALNNLTFFFLILTTSCAYLSSITFLYTLLSI